MNQLHDILGCILAGGRSSRFGRDKARALLHGRPLLLHAADALRPLCPAVVAVADRAGKYDDLQVEALVDLQPGRGPLAGLEAALLQAQARYGERAWVLLAPCDTVGVPAEWLLQLRDSLQPGDAAAAFRDLAAPVDAKALGWEPLPLLVAAAALPAVQQALATGQTALWRLLEALPARAVARPGAWPERVRRLDRPEELQALHEAQPVRQDLPVALQRWSPRGALPADDWLAIEEPLEIRVEYGQVGRRRRATIGVVLRTPGHEAELVAGLLWGEAAIGHGDDVLEVSLSTGELPVVTARLRPGLAFDPKRLSRHLVTTAACGACGSPLLDAALPKGRGQLHGLGPAVAWSVLAGLPAQLRALQTTFDRTGGLHAAGLFSAAGEPVLAREDIGRHNALDKLVGHLVLTQQLGPPGVLVLSGRIGYELVQKAAMAGLPLLVGVGAPTSLAVDLADRAGMTLVGFVRGGCGNVYTSPWRVI
ncbi:MAG: formate dehydrogenase accessory sulfurtransferase FdhD [Deltaproteobacteria bacterium]|nr:formate dehydrogenase accessory sulfurtransferase FdhD [Deltaproteobacteria bacterium]